MNIKHKRQNIFPWLQHGYIRPLKQIYMRLYMYIEINNNAKMLEVIKKHSKSCRMCAINWKLQENSTWLHLSVTFSLSKDFLIAYIKDCKILFTWKNKVICLQMQLCANKYLEKLKLLNIMKLFCYVSKQFVTIATITKASDLPELVLEIFFYNVKWKKETC